ncbi:MAG: hypothetical protein G01um101466_632, partial [Parcubacteria group bacterium Gr01-1014_66]
MAVIFPLTSDGFAHQSITAHLNSHPNCNSYSFQNTCRGLLNLSRFRSLLLSLR